MENPENDDILSEEDIENIIYHLLDQHPTLDPENVGIAHIDHDYNGYSLSEIRVVFNNGDIEIIEEWLCNHLMWKEVLRPRPRRSARGTIYNLSDFAEDDE